MPAQPGKNGIWGTDMKKLAAFVVVVGAVFLFGYVIGTGDYYHRAGEEGAQYTPYAWLTKQIECPTPEKFFVNYLTAISNVPTQYYPDIILIMYSIYYTSQRTDGAKDPFGFLDNSDDYGAMLEVLSKAMLPLYKVCVKDGFSFSKLVSVEQSIKNKHEKYYNEFVSKHYEELYHALHLFPSWLPPEYDAGVTGE